MTLSTGTGNPRSRTIAAFFDSRSDAENAVARLKALGLSDDSVRLVPGYERDTETAVDNTYDRPGEGFWDSLRDFFIPDEDRDTYAEGLRRGGYLVTVTCDDEWYEQSLDILDDEGTIDIDERAETWRSEGWAGRSSTTALAGDSDSVSGIKSSAPATAPALDISSTSALGTSSASANVKQGEEVIPIVEENLRVGKRDVSHGRVRVRSYVVETPVSEQVNLREERVQIDRRPVDRPLSDADRAFQDRTIEAEERREEAVVSKEARVKEELVIRKDVEERTETVSDSVRSTEIKVEDERLSSEDSPQVTDRR